MTPAVPAPPFGLPVVVIPLPQTPGARADSALLLGTGRSGPGAASSSAATAAGAVLGLRPSAPAAPLAAALAMAALEQAGVGPSSNGFLAATGNQGDAAETIMVLAGSVPLAEADGGTTMGPEGALTEPTAQSDAEGPIRRRVPAPPPWPYNALLLLIGIGAPFVVWAAIRRDEARQNRHLGRPAFAGRTWPWQRPGWSWWRIRSRLSRRVDRLRTRAIEALPLPKTRPRPRRRLGRFEPRKLDRWTPPTPGNGSVKASGRRRRRAEERVPAGGRRAS